LLSWRPDRQFDLWHDRAVFHFLVASEDRDTYLRTMRLAVRDNGFVVLGTFAPDGPHTCSGLPVAGYSASDLAELLGAEFEALDTRREEHITPSGAIQPFTWVAARMRGQPDAGRPLCALVKNGVGDTPQHWRTRGDRGRPSAG
jgi:hypothetical protein